MKVHAFVDVGKRSLLERGRYREWGWLIKQHVPIKLSGASVA